MGCRRARSAPALSSPPAHIPLHPVPLTAPLAVCVATTAARIITVRKHVSPQDCLLIPAGHVLVCVYSQQIPPTACSLAITKSSRAGKLCSLPHPSSLNPSSLPCSQGQFKGFHICQSPSDSQFLCSMCAGRYFPSQGVDFPCSSVPEGSVLEHWCLFCASSPMPSSRLLCPTCKAAYGRSASSHPNLRHLHFLSCVDYL